MCECSRVAESATPTPTLLQRRPRQLHTDRNGYRHADTNGYCYCDSYTGSNSYTYGATATSTRHRLLQLLRSKTDADAEICRRRGPPNAGAEI
jgi:hypothetical protein